MAELQRHLSQPFYEQLKQWLRQKIVSGQFQPDTAVPDEDALAAEMGVSAMTARRALVELADEGLLKRVRGKGTFVRPSFSPRPRTRRTGVGIVSTFNYNDPGGIFYHRIFHAVQVASEAAGISLMYRQAIEPYEAFIRGLADDTSLKALLVVGVGSPDLLALFERSQKPVVLLDSVQPVNAPPFDEVNYSAEEAIVDAVSSLLKQGHREIGLMRSEYTNAFHLQRQVGYERALRAFGVPIRPELIHLLPLHPDASYARMNRILDSGPIPTAMFCADDEMALAAMIAALEHGMKLPRDLSMIGMGGFDVFTSPPLSTVRLPMRQLGTTAVQVLKERIDNPTAPVKRVLLPAEWTPRASCAGPRA